MRHQKLKFGRVHNLALMMTQNEQVLFKNAICLLLPTYFVFFQKKKKRMLTQKENIMVNESHLDSEQGVASKHKPKKTAFKQTIQNASSSDSVLSRDGKQAASPHSKKKDSLDQLSLPGVGKS
jgi:hypothetical protein